jgi:hypothetical protein
MKRLLCRIEGGNWGYSILAVDALREEVEIASTAQFLDFEGSIAIPPQKWALRLVREPNFNDFHFFDRVISPVKDCELP